MATLLLDATPTDGWLAEAGDGNKPMPALRFQKEVGKTAGDKKPRLVRDRTGLDKGWGAYR
jgi:hypothetical protein